MPSSRTLLAVLLPLLSFAAAAAPAPTPLLVGYFGQWGVYDGILPRSLVTSGAATLLTQINYAQGFVANGRCTVADPHADLDLAFTAANSVNRTADSPTSPFRGNLHQFAELKRLHPGLKLLISLEGKADDFAFDARPENRAAFIRSCVDTFLRGHLAPGVTQPHLFDGIDLDWEYPHGDDAGNFLALVTELRHAMNAVRPGLRLAVAVGASPRMVSGVDIPAIAAAVDQVGVMNYDYHGPWNPSTDFIAPLFAPESNPNAGSVERSLDEWQTAGIPASKLLLGLPFYGYGWQGVADTDHGFQQPGKAIRGDRPYSFFAPLAVTALTQTPATTATPATPLPLLSSPRDPLSSRTPTGPIPAAQQPPTAPARSSAPVPRPPTATVPADPAPFTLFRDPHSQAPWLYNGSTFWTFEDPTSIRFKAAFARDHHLAGAMIWELGNDTPNAALTHAAHQGLRPNHSLNPPNPNTRTAP